MSKNSLGEEKSLKYFKKIYDEIFKKYFDPSGNPLLPKDLAEGNYLEKILKDYMQIIGKTGSAEAQQLMVKKTSRVIRFNCTSGRS